MNGRPPISAGPLFPCIKAVSSNTGNFVAIVDVQPKSEQGSAWKPPLVSISVLPKENFVNGKDNFAAAVMYWTNRVVWSVVLDSSRMTSGQGCPLPLISDDGEFLILLRTGPAFGDDAVLQIYQRRDHPGDLKKDGPDHGIFIKDIALAEVWPATTVLAANSVGWDDESPQWFAGGIFNYSEDHRQLIHKTRWGNTIRINLEDGTLSKE